MRIATFNIFSGRPQDGETTDPEQLAKGVATLDADVLGLQEVDRGQERSGGVDQAALAAEALGAEHWRFVPALVGTPGATWRPAGAREDEVDGHGGHSPAMYGVALVSRYPVRSWHVLRLRRIPVRAPVVVHRADGRRKLVVVHDEPRAAIAAVVDTPAGPVTVATTHLTFVPLWNLAQLRSLSRWMGSLPCPQFLVGDLNMPSPLPRSVCRDWQSLVSAPTWPARRPRAQLDHILARGGVPQVTRSDAPRLDLSDHRALIVDLAAAEAAPRG